MAPTTSCQSLGVGLARRNSTLLASTSGSPLQTIPPARCAETFSEAYCYQTGFECLCNVFHRIFFQVFPPFAEVCKSVMCELSVNRL